MLLLPLPPQCPLLVLWEGLSLPGEELSDGDYVPEEQESSFVQILVRERQTGASSSI